MTLVVLMAFNILVALGLGFVVGRIWQIRCNLMERQRDSGFTTRISSQVAHQR